MAKYSRRRTALRHAISVMETWEKMDPCAFDGMLPGDIEALKEVLAETGQQRLPWPEQNAVKA